MELSLALSLGLGLGLGLFVLGQWLTRRAAKGHSLHLQQLQSATLQRALALLDNLQKHRGLGAQQDIASVSQRRAIARQIDQLWLNWPGAGLRLAPLQRDWPQLRRHPADFAAHCQLIEGLLDVIEQLEERLASPSQPPLGTLGRACRELENLARLRGLAVRAANYQRCPAGLQLPMRLLCEKLAHPSSRLQVRQLLQRLQQDLLDAPRVRLAPGECFALFTAAIEEHARDLRLSLPCEPSN